MNTEDDMESIGMMSEKKTTPKKKKGHLLVVILNLIIFGGALYFALMFLNENEHKKYEKEMLALAKTYFEQNFGKYSQETYIEVGKLGYIPPNDCSSLSGVLYDGESMIPYLSCSEYESDLESNLSSKEYITLNGSGIVLLLKGMSYEEPGYVSNSAIKVYGSVGDEEGIYTIYYMDELHNVVVQRKVIVVDNSILTNQYPTLSINDSKVQYVLVNSTYDESSLKATDSLDGDISYKIKRLGYLDTNTVGDYNISYVINNSRGYRVYKQQAIKVVEHLFSLKIDESYSPIQNTKDDVTITIKVTGDTFDHILLPNDTISQSKESEYKVSENGTYQFVIYDVYGMSEKKDITISNIDKLLPSGTCTTILYGNRSKTTVNLSSGRDVASYEFVLDGSSSGPLKTSEYESNTKPLTSIVKIVDIKGSTNEIICTTRAPEIYTDSTGKNCLEGYACYIQFNYKSSKYPYCSMSTENTCGTISRNGCSITSATIAIAGLGVKSQSGSLYNPYTVWDELYQVNKKTGYCEGGCSAWSRIRGAIKNAGLAAAEKSVSLSGSTKQALIDHLKKGYPAVAHAGEGPYAVSKGHYMAIIGIRDEDDYVFLSDPATTSGTFKKKYNGKVYYTDTYVSLDELIKGNVDAYLLVGPAGYTF